jgi:NADH-quinone oxidoreductase subunit N
MFLSFTILIQLIFGSSLATHKARNFPVFDKEIVFQTVLILLGSFYIQYCDNTTAESSLLSNDIGSLTVKKLVLFFSVLLTIVMGRGFVVQTISFAEFFTIFLLSLLGVLFLISSCDFLIAYLVLEMQALSFYILACFRKNSSFSTDAGLKYFVLGSFVSCIYLMGCLLIYGGLGTLNFNALMLLLSFPLENNYQEIEKPVFFGFFLVVVALMFKLAIVPFHFWAPDVYEGAPLCSTIGFSIIPKIGLLYFFFKLLNIIGFNFFVIPDLLMISGYLSISAGAFLALRQTKLKRLVLYSSLSQTGFFALTLSLGTHNGFCALFVYALVYILSSIILWGYIVEFYSSQQKENRFKNNLIHTVYLTSMSNLFEKSPIAALLLMLLLFSIGGMPPSSGFLSKVLVLKSLIESNYFAISIGTILVSSVSFYYYMRLIKVVFFEIQEIQGSKETFRSSFKDEFRDLFCCIAVFGSFGLYFFFFSPELVLISADLIVLGTTGY